MEFVVLFGQGRLMAFKKGILNTRYGKLDLRKAKPGKTITSSSGAEFFVLYTSLRDAYLLMKRGPQVILPEIMGLIASKTFPQQDWRIAEAGGGSGYATLFLSYMCSSGRVYSYERNESHFSVLKKNVEMLGLDNVATRNRDIHEMREKNLDMILLDMKGPETMVEKAFQHLKPGRFLVVYSPQIEQVIAVMRAVEEKGIPFLCETFEPIIRKWKVDIRGYTHPEYGNLSHTGFVTICRKIGR